MAKIQANPLELKRFWHEAVAGSTLPRKAQADAVGVGYTTWCAWADLEQPDALPPPRRLPIALREAIDHPAFVDYLASLQGRVTVPLPDEAACSEVELASLCAEFGRAVEHAASAIASDGWDAQEAARQRALGRRLITAVLGWQLRIDREAAANEQRRAREIRRESR